MKITIALAVYFLFKQPICPQCRIGRSPAFSADCSKIALVCIFKCIKDTAGAYSYSYIICNINVHCVF